MTLRCKAITLITFVILSLSACSRAGSTIQSIVPATTTESTRDTEMRSRTIIPDTPTINPLSESHQILVECADAIVENAEYVDMMEITDTTMALNTFNINLNEAITSDYIIYEKQIGTIATEILIVKTTDINETIALMEERQQYFITKYQNDPDHDSVSGRNEDLAMAAKIGYVNDYVYFLMGPSAVNDELILLGHLT